MPGHARQVDDGNWAVLDENGQQIGIIWREETLPMQYRCASRGRRVKGITHRSFDVVLRYALETFS